MIMTLDTPLFKKWSNGIPFEQQKLVSSKTSRDMLLFICLLRHGLLLERWVL